MTQLRALLKLQLTQVWSRMTNMRQRGGGSGKPTKTAGRSLLFSILYLYLAAVFVFLFGGTFMQLAPVYAAADLGWVYFLLAFLMATGIMLIGSVFLAKSLLFEAKDNDLLLAMPIPPQTILLSRMVSLLIMNLGYGFTVAAPALFAWQWAGSGCSVIGILFFILLFFACALLALSLSCLLGWGLAKISSRIRNKTLTTVLFSIIFIVAYYYFIGKGAGRIMTLLTENGDMIADVLGAMLPLYWLGSAVASADILAFLGAFCILAGIFLLVFLLLSKTFLRTATTVHGLKRKAYRAAAMHTASPASALLKKENRRLLTNANYLLNAGIGLLFVLAASVFLLWKRSQINTMIGEVLTVGSITNVQLCALAALGLCFMLSMVLFTAPSISLEGKTLWILRVMPVSVKDILRAKLRLHLIWTLPPTLLFSISASIVFSEGNLFGIFTLFALPILYTTLHACLGLIFGLQHANFSWINEAQAVKQGASVLLSILCGTLLVLVPGILFFVARPPMLLFVPCCLFALAIGCIASYHWLMTRGVQKFISYSV